MQERALPLGLRVNKEETKNLEAEPKEFSPSQDSDVFVEVVAAKGTQPAGGGEEACQRA